MANPYRGEAKLSDGNGTNYTLSLSYLELAKLEKAFGVRGRALGERLDEFGIGDTMTILKVALERHHKLVSEDAINQLMEKVGLAEIRKAFNEVYACAIGGPNKQASEQAADPNV